MTNQLVDLLNKPKIILKEVYKLIEQGEDPRVKTDAGNTLLHILANHNLTTYGMCFLATLINVHKLDINAKNEEGQTPLQILINKKKWSARDALFLVGLGADPAITDSNGRPLIHLLANTKTTHNSDKFISGVAYHWQSFMTFINNHNWQYICSEPLLLEVLDNHDLMNVITNYFPALQKVLAQPDYYTLLTKVRDSISFGLNQKYNDDLIDSALSLDSINTSYVIESDILRLIHKNPELKILGQPKIRKFLIDINKPFIHHLNKAEALAILVSAYNVNINAKNAQGQTILEYAMNNSANFNTSDWLFFIKLGADPNTKNNNGKTILHRLAEETKDNSAVIRELIDQYHADDTITDNNGKTALDISLEALTVTRMSANTYEFIRSSKQFAKQVSDSVSNDKKDISMLNKLITTAHTTKDKQSYALQGVIRETAFSALKESLKTLSPTEKLEKLEWAKTQPIFCMHRSHFFLAKIGRTKTHALIDSMIADLQEHNTPTLKIK